MKLQLKKINYFSITDGNTTEYKKEPEIDILFYVI